MRMTGYPNGGPGYVVDHIVPLKRGGCDCPSNMQWQTVQEAKAKDRWESQTRQPRFRSFPSFSVAAYAWSYGKERREINPSSL
jgi:hypothetical protein